MHYQDGEYYKPHEAAEIIGVSQDTIRRWCERGVFVGVIRQGITEKKRYLIPAGEVERVKREGNFEAGKNNVAHLAA
jgi:predicted site-specific integrase-resolvase